MSEKLEFTPEVTSLILALKGAGITRVEYDYYGSNDSLNDENLGFYKRNPKFGQKKETTNYRGDKILVNEPEYIKADKPDGAKLLQDWMWSLVDSHHSCFYNNDGGSGEMILYLQGNEPDRKYPYLEWRHSTYETISHDDHYKYEV